MSEQQDTSFGKIPKEWNVVKFSDALKIKGRIGWKGYKTSDLREYGPVVIGGVNIKSNIYLDYSTLTHLSREKYEESPEIMLKKGDVLLVTRGNGIGDVGRFNGEYHEATINPSVVIFSDFSGDSKFLYYFLSSPQGNDQIMSMEGGSSIPALYQGLLKTLALPFPKINTQKAIASILSSLDDKIDLLHRQNQTLEAMAETLFRQWFVEEAQEDWETAKIGAFCKTNTLSVTKDTTLKTIRYLDTGSLTEGKIDGFQIFEMSSAPSRARRIVKHNDVLISTVRPNQKHYGIIKHPDEDIIISTGFCVITCEKINPHFIYIFLTSKEMTEYLHSIAEASTTTYPSLKPSDLEILEFKLPPDARLNAFSEYADNAWNKIEYNHNQIHTLQKFRDTLLPKLMNGEVRVEYNK